MDGPKSVTHVLKGHSKDVTCTVWSPRSNGVLASGGGDGVVNVWNIANIAAEDELLKGKLNGASPPGLVFKHMGTKAITIRTRSCCLCVSCTHSAPFRHLDATIVSSSGAGHRAEVSEIQWSPFEPWTMLSISTDTEVGGGGTLQIWRISDMITRPEPDVLEELNRYKDEILANEKKDDANTMG